MKPFSYRHAGRFIMPPPGFIEELQSAIPSTAACFLEWGAGCSTLFLQELARERGASVLTLESSEEWFRTISNLLDYKGSKIVLQDLTGARESQADPELNYGTYPLSHGPFDFILIDGRRRIECAVTSLAVSHKDTVVALHDYRRARYQATTLFYECTDGKQFRVMRKK